VTFVKTASPGSTQHVKKGRHRRFEEARAFKLRTTELSPAPCEECGAEPDDEHASWCMATEDAHMDEAGGREL
jgi:hypothetical protein